MPQSNDPWDNFPKLKGALEALRKDIRKKPGRFLYSQLFTLRPGPFYLLGFNPSIDKNNKEDKKRLCEEIRDWPAKNINAIEKEKWPSNLQRNIKRLFTALDYDFRLVCASNLFFLHSKERCSLPMKPEEVLDAHWRVHEQVLELVRPKCIIAFGTAKKGGTYIQIRNLLIQRCGDASFEENEKCFYSGHKGYSCYTTEGLYKYSEPKTRKVRPLKLIGIPHLSRYSPENKLITPLSADSGEKHTFKEWINEQCSSEASCE
jgi:hypothetical protein